MYNLLLSYEYTMNKSHKKILLILLSGVLLGTASSLGDVLPFGSLLYIIGGFLNTASVWSLSAFLIGTQFRSRKNSIIFSISFLALPVLSYYIVGYLWGNRGEVPLITLVSTALSWIFIGIFIGALCGLSGRTAKHTKNLRKRIIAMIIPMAIILTESTISLIQLLPYLNLNSNNYIPFLMMVLLFISACGIPFIIFKNRRVAVYTLILALLISSAGSLLLITISNL